VYEDCKKKFNDAQKNISEIKALQKDPEGFISDYFGEVIRRSDLRREELKDLRREEHVYAQCCIYGRSYLLIA